MYYKFNIVHDLSHIREDEVGITKTVTIRGVNAELYDSFSQLASQFGINTGYMFSRLIEGYGKQYHPFLLGPGYRKQIIKLHDHSHVEVIADMKSLQISKKDLTEAGEDVRYIFRNISQLTFDETVDNKTLMTHVLRIRNCSIQVKGHISTLFLKSINPGLNIENYYNDLDQEMTNVTIRNVSEEIYNEFAATCQKRKVKIGDAVNGLIKRALPHIEISQIMMHDHKIDPVDLIVLTMQETINVSNQDLLDLEGRKVMFHRIKHLNLANDITNNLFKERVVGIYNCSEVKLPGSIPRLLQLSRIKKFPRST